MTGIYEADLAFIHAAAFGDVANAAITSLIPRLKAGRAQRVIDVGCGAGVSSRLLVEAGFDTLAVDPSAALLELARKAAPAARFLHGSAYDVALTTCDARAQEPAACALSTNKSSTKPSRPSTMRHDYFSTASTARASSQFAISSPPCM